MNLKNFELRKGNYFIAMEYYMLILNRTFLVLITDDDLIGLKVNGLISVEVNDPFSNHMVKNMVVKNDLNNPFSYIKKSFAEKLKNLDVFSDKILKVDKANFKINRQNIKSVKYDKRKKWGMGYYPHDGKVYIKTIRNKKKEFIILGAQSGEEIKRWIEKTQKLE